MVKQSEKEHTFITTKLLNFTIVMWIKLFIYLWKKGGCMCRNILQEILRFLTQGAYLIFIYLINIHLPLQKINTYLVMKNKTWYNVGIVKKKNSRCVTGKEFHFIYAVNSKVWARPNRY